MVGTTQSVTFNYGKPILLEHRPLAGHEGRRGGQAVRKVIYKYKDFYPINGLQVQHTVLAPLTLGKWALQR